MESKRLKLCFKDDENNSKTLSIENCMDSYTDEEVSNAMDDIISSNVINTKVKPIATKSKAYLQVTTTTEFNLSESV